MPNAEYTSTSVVVEAGDLELRVEVVYCGLMVSPACRHQQHGKKKKRRYPNIRLVRC